MADLPLQKLEDEVVMRESASDAFHDMFQNRPHHVTNAHPEFIQGCDLHEGEFGTIGSIISWDYILDGKPHTLKQEILEIDEENKMMKFKCVGGELANEYEPFYTTFKVIPKDNESCIVKWIFEFQKIDAHGRDPSNELQALVELAKKIDDYHHQQN